MKNAEILSPENPNESNWTDAPLFAPNVVPQINNAIPPITETPINSPLSDQKFLLPINVEPQKISTSFRLPTPSANPNLSAAENSKLNRIENSDISQKENLESAGSEKSVLQPKKKSRRKTPVKKVRSQKRNVVPLKLFVSPAEKNELETRARERNCSLSNYVRLNLGLAPNEAGRKKQNVVAAFDLSEFDLED